MKKYINMLLAIAAFTGLVSCNDDFLDLEPKGSVTEASAFATFETCTDYSLNLYNVFNGPNVNAAAVYFQGPTVNYSSGLGSSQRDIWSGLLTQYTNGYSTIPNMYAAQTVTIPTTSAAYSYPYQMIRTANILLEHLNDGDLNDAQRKHLEAVARFFRAYCHYALLLNFGDCIYVDKVLGENSEELMGSRSSRLFVADQIYKELQWCESNIQDDLAEPNTINSDVVKAFMSRFCLFEGTWRKYHNVAESGEYVSGTQLLQTCVAVSKDLAAKYPTLYTGDNNDKHPGKGWGQMWTTENLGKVPSVLLYVKHVEDKKMHRLGHYEHIASACLEMPQSTVDLYLTVDGLPIHNANVKTYDYNGLTKTYTESATPYDYANADSYKTFRKRDPRLWQMVTPPYHVINNVGTNGWVPDESNDGVYSEFIHQFAPRGNKKTDASGNPYWDSPNFNVAYHQVETHKSLPSTNWAGNVLPGVPHTQMSDNANKYNNGKIGYYGGKGFQRGKSSYFVWKHVANWDRQDPTFTADISDKPVFKMEEVLLNYAEAAFELGQFNQSIADITINRLRDRAEVGRMNVAVIDENFDPDRDKSVAPVLWEIRRERLIELMGESFSFDDVRRWKKGDWFVNKHHYGAWVNSDNLDAVVSRTGGQTGVMNNATHLEASPAEASAQGGGHLYYYLDPKKAGKGWLDKYYLMPIPTEELLLNPNLQQQDAWK